MLQLYMYVEKRVWLYELFGEISYGRETRFEATLSGIWRGRISILEAMS